MGKKKFGRRGAPCTDHGYGKEYVKADCPTCLGTGQVFKRVKLDKPKVRVRRGLG